MPLPPPSTLLYMFADEVVEGDDWKSAGTEVPGTTAKVKLGPLTAHIYAISLWSLAQEGVVELTHEEKKRLGIRTSKAHARLTGAAPARDSRIESGLLEALAGGKPREVYDVVYDAIGDDYTKPRAQIVSWAASDGIPSGCFADVDTGRGAVGRMLLGATRTEPQVDRFPGVRPAFDALLASWRSWTTAEPQLAATLLKQCERAIDNRHESDDDD